MKKKNMVVFALSGLLLAVSFALPGAVLAIRDSAIESKVEYVTMDEVELSLLSSLSSEEKLRLAGDRSAASISLDTGVRMDKAQAEAAALEGAHDMVPYADWSSEEVSPYLTVGADGKSLVLWEALMTYQNSTLRLRLDDETGAILGLALSEMTHTEFAQADKDAAGMPSWERMWELILKSLGLETESVLYDASGMLVMVAGSDLAIRITVSGENGTDIWLNMG